MKVLNILNTSQYSGAENVACQIIHAMQDEKDMELAYCSRDGQIREALAERNVTFIPVKDVSVSEIKRVIAEFKPDIIHAHDMYAGFKTALACGKIPMISHIHHNAYDARHLSLKSIAYLLPGMKAKCIFWVSESSYKGYVFHKLFKKKSETLYNVINIDKVYEKMSLDTNTYDYDIIYVGRFSYQKNPQRLMNVFSEIAKKLPDVKIAAVGTGELEQETKELAKELHLDKNLDFLGFCSNPLKMMHDAKLMIMTSRWEGTPMCVLEAMTLGLPLVSTPTDGVCELITNDVTGYLSDDDTELVEKTVEIIKNAEKQKSMSAAIKERAVEINNIKEYKQKILKQYRRSVKK